MFSNNFFDNFESLLVFLFVGLCFLQNPLVAIILLLLFSFFKSQYISLCFFSFSYDILYGNMYFNLPLVSISVLIISLLAYFLKYKVVKLLRHKSLSYDF